MSGWHAAQKSFSYKFSLTLQQLATQLDLHLLLNDRFCFLFIYSYI